MTKYKNATHQEVSDHTSLFGKVMHVDPGRFGGKQALRVAGYRLWRTCVGTASQMSRIRLSSCGNPFRMYQRWGAIFYHGGIEKQFALDLGIGLWQTDQVDDRHKSRWRSRQFWRTSLRRWRHSLAVGIRNHHTSTSHRHRVASLRQWWLWSARNCIRQSAQTVPDTLTKLK